MKCYNNSNIVQPDNTPLVCDEYLSDECIIHTEAIAYLSLPANSTQQQINTALLASLIDARERIAVLESIIENEE